MKKIKILLLSVLISLAFSSCDLDLYPDNAQTTDQYWNTKSDVEAVVGAGYVKLRNSVDYLFIWGEARGTGIEMVTSADDMPKSATEIREMKTRNTNTYTKWGGMYQIINMANSVLKYGPQVAEKDPSFTEQEMNGYFSEAYFLRSLAYFYLVKTFKDVPFITEPYVNDDTQFEYGQSTEEYILAQIKADLIKALPSAKEFYNETNTQKPVNTKGRATKWSIYALLADIYLWEGDYDKCIDACNAVIGSGRVGLIGKELWFTNFADGNTNESIFEIQYDNKKGQTNSFISWFTTKPYFAINQLNAMWLYTAADVRGEGGTYSPTYGLWKYQGLNFYATSSVARDASSNNDQNFIIYRLAEIYLMRAEAYIMKGSEYFEDAINDIERIRDRAAVEGDLSVLGTEKEMLQILLYERQRELCAEGKAWFDLLRIARRHDYEYKELMMDEVLLTVPTGLYAAVRSKLMDPGSHYLPIHRDEMTANGLLEQNSYYQAQGF